MPVTSTIPTMGAAPTTHTPPEVERIVVLIQRTPTAGGCSGRGCQHFGSYRCRECGADLCRQHARRQVQVGEHVDRSQWLTAECPGH